MSDNGHYLHHRLGYHYADHGMRRLQGPQVVELHRRSPSGHRLPLWYRGRIATRGLIPP